MVMGERDRSQRSEKLNRKEITLTETEYDEKKYFVQLAAVTWRWNVSDNALEAAAVQRVSHSFVSVWTSAREVGITLLRQTDVTTGVLPTGTISCGTHTAIMLSDVQTRRAPIMLCPIIGRLPIVYLRTHLRSIKVILLRLHLVAYVKQIIYDLTEIRKSDSARLGLFLSLGA